MKTILKLCILTMVNFTFISCSVVSYLFESPLPSKEEMFLQALQNFTQSSLFNVDYNSLRLNPDLFAGEKIRVFGVIVEELDGEFLLFTNPFEDNEYGFYRISIDSPLPKNSDYPKPLRYIGRSSEVNIFGIFKGLSTINPRKIKSDTKSLNPHINFTKLRNLPTIEAVIIYDRSDLRFERPLWVSQEFINKNYNN